MECRWRENVPKAKEHVQFSICAFRTHTAHTQTFTAMEFIFLFQSHSLTPLPLIRHKFFITSLIRLHAKRAAVAFLCGSFGLRALLILTCIEVLAAHFFVLNDGSYYMGPRPNRKKLRRHERSMNEKRMSRVN